jgi:isoleucyl-tRNA synthetase
VTLAADEVLVQSRQRAGLAVAGEGDVTVALDTQLTPELVREGVARELVRAVNDLRKRAGLEITDRITLAVQGEGVVADALRDWRDYVAAETLATAWAQAPAEGFVVEQMDLDGVSVTLALRVAR